MTARKRQYGVTLDARTAERVDALARAFHMSRSAIIRMASRRGLDGLADDIRRDSRASSNLPCARTVG